MRFEEIDHIMYFAYGHNTNSNEMKDRCPDARHIGHAVLKNFRFELNHFANIVSDDGAETHGVLWNISQKELKELDVDEGLHDHYNRIPVQVKFGDKTLQAAAYIMDPGYHPPDSLNKKYLKLVIEGYKENDLPLEQIKQAIK